MILITKADELVGRTINILCKEEAFPKRSRWLVGQKIADVAQDFHTQLNLANEIRCDKMPSLYPKRREAQLMAQAYLMTLDRKMSSAVVWFHINEDLLDAWAGVLADVRSYLMSWISSDEKRYNSGKN